MSQENAKSRQPLIRAINRQQTSWRAVDVERLIGEDHRARAIWTLVGRLDLKRFYDGIESSAEEGGRPAFDPQLLISLGETNRYVCPEGKLLRPQGRHTKSNRRGQIAYLYEAKFSDCQSCHRKSECCPENQSDGRGVLRLEETAVVAAFRKKMASEEARAQYHRRGRVVEFCHAWIKSKLGLRQFHVRGLAKVLSEMLWACLTYNLQQWVRLSKPQAISVAS